MQLLTERPEIFRRRQSAIVDRGGEGERPGEKLSNIMGGERKKGAKSIVRVVGAHGVSRMPNMRRFVLNVYSSFMTAMGHQ